MVCSTVFRCFQVELHLLWLLLCWVCGRFLPCFSSPPSISPSYLVVFKSGLSSRNKKFIIKYTVKICQCKCLTGFYNNNYQIPAVPEKDTLLSIVKAFYPKKRLSLFFCFSVLWNEVYFEFPALRMKPFCSKGCFTLRLFKPWRCLHGQNFLA